MEVCKLVKMMSENPVDLNSKHKPETKRVKNIERKENERCVSIYMDRSIPQPFSAILTRDACSVFVWVVIIRRKSGNDLKSTQIQHKSISSCLVLMSQVFAKQACLCL